MQIVISRRARADLRDIGDFIARDRPIRARTFVGELLETCRGLAVFPEKWPIERAFSDVARRAVYGNYLIFYSVSPGVVRIEHIVHGSHHAGRHE